MKSGLARPTGSAPPRTQAQYSDMADAIPQIVWVTDGHGNAEYFNRQWYEYTGSDRQPSSAQQVSDDFVHPDDAQRTIAAFNEARATGLTYAVEHRIRSASGEYRWFLVRGEPKIDPETGEIVRFIGSSTDIHDRKLMEAALRDSEERLRFLAGLENQLFRASDAVEAMAAAASMLGRELQASRCAYADVFSDTDTFWIRSDYTAPGVETSTGTYSLDLFGPRAAADMRAGRTLIVHDVASELAPGEGREMFQSIGIQAIICCPLIKNGALAAMMAVHNVEPREWSSAEITLVRDVVERCWSHVERVGAEARLRDSEERLRLAVDNAEIGFWDVDVVNDVLIWPPRTKAMFGISPDVPVTMQDFYDGLHPDDREETSAAYAAAADPRLRALYDVEYRTVGKEDGLIRWVAAKGRGVFEGSGEHARCVRILGTAIDITARKTIQERLRELNDRLESEVEARTAERNRVWEMSRDLFAIMGFDGHLKAINPAWETTLGMDTATLLSLPFPEQVHPADHDSVRAVMEVLLKGESVDRFEDRLRHADGSWRWISWALVPESDVFYAVGRDVTAEKEAAAELEAAQEALRQSQKMEAMGQLTGGVAHDFNNLLTPIVGSLDMLQRRGVGNEREQRLIAGAALSAERARTLVQRLLAFARRQPLQPIPVDLGKLVTGMVDLVASTSGPRVKVEVDLASENPAVIADPNQLEMAILNLAVNARDAMPDGGSLTIAAREKALTDGAALKLQPGRYVRLSVSDTGVGMDTATAKRAIEPFFSTKGVGRGTGLGLSMVHGLAAQLGGAMRIKSRLGVGTTVELWLPVATASAPEAQAGDRVLAAASTGTALLVDDEDLVRASTADMLSELGYRVTEAASAEQALRLLDEGLAPDVLVTDHLMPGLTGTEFARVVKERQPAAKILVISGYAQDDGVAPDLPRLTKPFRQSELADSLAKLTGEPAQN